MSEDRCVICGQIIPEGTIVCPTCEKSHHHGNTHYHMASRPIVHDNPSYIIETGGKVNERNCSR